MESERLFVYGTLKDPRVQERVIGRKFRGVNDILEGYAVSKIKLGLREYPVLIKKAGSEVEGLVLSITADDLKLTDCYETPAYERRKVLLKSRKGAWVYVKRNMVKK